MSICYACKVHPELSDLFFNHEHPAYDQCILDEECDDGDDVQAITKDAEAFIANYENTHALFGSPTADEMAADFLARL